MVMGNSKNSGLVNF